MILYMECRAGQVVNGDVGLALLVGSNAVVVGAHLGSHTHTHTKTTKSHRNTEHEIATQSTKWQHHHSINQDIYIHRKLKLD